MITTIIFDLSEVYLNGLKGTDTKINEKYGTTIENPTMATFEGALQFFHGEITEEAYWQAVIDTFHVPASVPELMEMVRENFVEITGTREILEKLKDNGYQLGLLSIHAKEWIAYCDDAFDYHKLFHTTMYSFETGVSKPDQKAYELLLAKLGAKAEACLFIDDNRKNLDTAEHLGMKTIQFITPEQLRSELHSLGIKL